MKTFKYSVVEEENSNVNMEKTIDDEELKIPPRAYGPNSISMNLVGIELSDFPEVESLIRTNVLRDINMRDYDRIEDVI
jgi:hypothetical protein